MATNGIVLITPSSVAKTGGSSTATINAGGSVTFGLCETLSLNGVFSSTYDNYIIDMRSVGSTNISLRLRLRASGTDNTTASSYVDQYIDVSGTSITAARQTSNQFSSGGGTYSTQRDGHTYFFYGPFLAQPTAMRFVQAAGLLGAYIGDTAGTHNQSTSYDGLTWITSSGTFSGLIKVYGLVK